MKNLAVNSAYYTILLMLAFWPSGVNVFLIKKKRINPKTIITLVILQILWLAALYFFLLSLIAYMIDKAA